jgi:hypothetical protein
MFARTAKYRNIGRGCSVAASVVPVHSNDNHIDCAICECRSRAPALVCRWRANALTGKPECHWEVESAPETSLQAKALRQCRIPQRAYERSTS